MTYVEKFLSTLKPTTGPIEDYGSRNTSDFDDTSHDYGPLVISIFAISMIIFLILALVGNTLVILTILRHKGMRTRTNMFIVNLAVADVLVAIFNMPFSLNTIIQGKWIYGDSFCQFNGFLVPLFFIVSIHTLMYISIHKYISITKPFSRTMTQRKIFIMIAASWIWGALCATTTLTGGNHVQFKKGASQCGPSIPDELNEYIHSIMITTCNYIIPLAVMCFCYVRIFQEIHEHMIRIRETSNIDLENSLDQQRRISCTLFLVLACFLICWTPFIIYSCYAATVKDKTRIPIIANPIAYWCGYMNSACNPIIYALRSPSFRQGYLEIICKNGDYKITGSIVSRPASLSGNHGISRNPSKQRNTEDRVLQKPQRSVLLQPQNGHLFDLVNQEPTFNYKLCTVRKGKKRLNSETSRTDANTEEQKKHILDEQDIEVANVTCTIKRVMSLKEIQTLELNDDSRRISRSLPQFQTPFRESSIFKKRATDLADCHSPVSEPASTHSSAYSTATTTNIDSIDSVDRVHQYPLVIIDEASLNSTENRNSQDGGKHTSVVSVTKFANFSSPSFTTQDELAPEMSGECSPVSIKSLEMGRSRRSSGNSIKMYQRVRLNDWLLSRNSRSGLDSPFYTASREQLLKWMSQDYLDCTEFTRQNVVPTKPTFSRFNPKKMSIKLKEKFTSSMSRNNIN